MAIDTTETQSPDEAMQPREPQQLTKETVAIPKSQGRVIWAAPVLRADEELRRDEVLESVVADLIEHYSNLTHLADVAIRVYWKKSGRTVQGLPKMGGVVKPGPWYEVGSGPGAAFLLWLAADHIADQRWTGYQLEAWLYHLLCGLQKTEEGETKLAGPDFQGYLPEIEAYGVWHGQLRTAGEIFRQPRLFEA